MLKLQCIKVVLLTASALLFGSAANATDEPTPLAFVRGMGITANFGQMLRFGASRMQTYRNIVCAVGSSAGQSLVEQEISAAIAKYQPQWDNNLAAAWSQLLSEGEMKSLLELKQQSPFAAKYQASGPKARQAIIASSSDLLQAALSEGMNNAWGKVPPERASNPAASCKN